MEIKLVSHINADDDILRAWFEYYTGLGISSFHLIVHGGENENRTLFNLVHEYPISIEAIYEGEFRIEHKKTYLQKCLASLRGNWIMLVDSDEFVEFPFPDLPTTIGIMKTAGANTLFAPMLQRLKADGSLDTPTVIHDPFHYFPLCSSDLYEAVGVGASTSKFPLFFCDEDTQITEGGNHTPPNGLKTRLGGIRGVTHHFKWKSSVLERLAKRANSTHRFRSESKGYLDYLHAHGNHLPTDRTFYYSREELFRRGLLKKEVQSDKDDLSALDGNPAWRKEFEDSYQWRKKVWALNDSLMKFISPEEPFILANENQIGADCLRHSNYSHFLEKDGKYWGLPENDITAISELEKLRLKGTRFFVLSWPCFWWLEHYVGLRHYLSSQTRLVLQNEALMLFNLGPESQALPASINS